MSTAAPGIDRATSIRLQLSGWLALGAVYFLLDLPGQPSAIGTLAVRALVWAALGWLASRLLMSATPLLPSPKNPGAFVLGNLAGAMLGGFVWFVLFHLVDWLVELEPGYISPLEVPPDLVLTELLSFVFPMLSWVGITLSLQHWAELAAARVEAERAAHLAKEAQLRMLRYQLNPHFLFNTLNSAIALVDVDGDRAQTMLMQLCEVLRHTLRDRSLTTTLRDELASIRDYLAIEQVRFADALSVEEQIEPEALDHSIPPLLLHPLVDNAIRHGFERHATVRLDLRAHQHENMLVLEVENDGQLDHDGAPGHGIGSRNVRERLEASYPDRHRFTLTQHGDRVRARIELQDAAA